MKSKLDAHCRQSESESSNLVAGSGATKNLPLPPTIPSPWNNPGFSAAELGSSSTSTSGNAATSAIGSWDTISNTSETSITGSQTFEVRTHVELFVLMTFYLNNNFIFGFFHSV